MNKDPIETGIVVKSNHECNQALIDILKSQNIKMSS